jgi:copper transporter 1
MLWNWNTIDSCFLASSWKITSDGVFAGSCIGVVLLVIALEMLRRGVKEYDRYLIAKHIKSQVETVSPKSMSDEGSPAPPRAVSAQGYRPTVMEQAIRALLHMLQFAVAYFVMLYVPNGLWSCLEKGHNILTLWQPRHVLQWLHHHLHLYWRLPRQLYLPLGAAWRVGVFH